MKMITSCSIFQLQIVIEWILATYMRDHTAGPDVVEHHAHALHAVHVELLSTLHEELVAHEVGTLVHHEAASLHPAGLAAVEVGGHVGTVSHARIGATLEVLVFVEDDLKLDSFLY